MALIPENAPPVVVENSVREGEGGYLGAKVKIMIRTFAYHNLIFLPDSQSHGHSDTQSVDEMSRSRIHLIVF